MKVKIISHSFECNQYYDYYLWRCSVEYNGEMYLIYLQAHKTLSGDYFWYEGGIKNTNVIKISFVNDWISFGYSNYINVYRYILESMIKVIKGDYSSIKGVGNCIDKPQNRIRISA